MGLFFVIEPLIIVLNLSSSYVFVQLYSMSSLSLVLTSFLILGKIRFQSIFRLSHRVLRQDRGR
jgi:hypothetical protein